MTRSKKIIRMLDGLIIITAIIAGLLAVYYWRMGAPPAR